MTSSPAPEEAIRECPLCGSPARLYEDDQSPLWCCVECTNGSQFGSGSECGMSGPWRKHTADAIVAWNRRAGGEREQQLEAQVREQEETILALQAEIRGIHDSQWNEIETAPHGVDVLLFSPADTWGNTTIEVGQASWGWRNSVANNMSYHGYATHWQPLPAPPRAALAGQTEGERNGG